MARYAIYEGNLERLEKKITTIKNKCEKYGYPFMYEVVGEEFKKYTDVTGQRHVIRYVLIEVEGEVTHNSWEFVAVVDHLEAGNVIRQMKQDIEVPTKYYTTEPVCEHCNTKRRRKDTYLIHNTDTDEWKQVGKTCLNEFTNGMNAEFVASYISLFDSIIEGESFGGGSSYEVYEPTVELLACAFETIKHFGYQPASEWEDRPTRARCIDYFLFHTGRSSRFTNYHLKVMEKELSSVNFNFSSEENKQLAEDAIDWVKTENSEGNSYIHNLQVICASEYVSGRNFGILISLGQTYRRYLGKVEAEKARKAAAASDAVNSQFVGQVGDKVEFRAVDLKVVYSDYNQFGVSFMYKFHDEKGNVYMWSTSTALDDDYEYTIKGSVKKHEEFRGVKQTWITRCRATKIEKSEPSDANDSTFDIDEIMEVFY